MLWEHVGSQLPLLLCLPLLVIGVRRWIVSPLQLSQL